MIVASYINGVTSKVGEIIQALANRLTAAENFGPEGELGQVLTSNGRNSPPSYKDISGLISGGVGKQGLQGPKGDTGETGATGVPGPPGMSPRTAVGFTVVNATDGGVWMTGSVEVTNLGKVLRISADQSCGVRLYNSAAARDADVAANRPRTTLPTPGSGVLAETWLAVSNGRSQWQSPVPDVYEAEVTPTGTWYWAVMNTMTATLDVSVSLLFVQLETV